MTVKSVQTLIHRKLHTADISMQFIWERDTSVNIVNKNSSSARISDNTQKQPMRVSKSSASNVAKLLWELTIWMIIWIPYTSKRFWLAMFAKRLLAIEPLLELIWRQNTKMLMFNYLVINATKHTSTNIAWLNIWKRFTTYLIPSKLSTWRNQMPSLKHHNWERDTKSSASNVAKLLWISTI